jgi:hypothetical protein
MNESVLRLLVHSNPTVGERYLHDVYGSSTSLMPSVVNSPPSLRTVRFFFLVVHFMMLSQ